MTKSQDMSEAEAFEGFEAPPAQGLYDPAHERDSCGVGFIADLKGRKSHQIVSDALKILANLEHRGAVGADPLAGDGAGMLIQIPHDFLKDECKKLGFTLPPPGRYAVGHIFMPRDERLRAHCERVWTRVVKEEGLELLGWRSVPVDNSSLSEMVKGTEPVHRQVFIGRPSSDPRSGGLRARAVPDAQDRLQLDPVRPTRTATSATTPCRCRAARSSTRACSCRIR